METDMISGECVDLQARSYRTYEEWKHWDIEKIIDKVKVLTVPMRNGNLLPDDHT